MACEPIFTDQAFLSSTLAHIDCQAQTIGSFGFSALGDQASPTGQILTVLLVIFIAIFGLRLLLGYSIDGRDVVTAILKIGIVLVMATSWPAYRTVVYNTVLHGPAEIASTIGAASELPGANGGLVNRLQTIDNALLELTARGSGRLQPVRGTVSGDTLVEAFRPYSVDDDLAFGSARVAWLAGAIGSLAVVRIGAGLLLALAPIFAGLLLFASTRAWFMSWIQGLVVLALASLAITITLAVQTALMEPLLQSALNLRAAGYAVPAVPTELLVITLAFAVALFAIMALLARIGFAGTIGPVSRLLTERSSGRDRNQQGSRAISAGPKPQDAVVSRAYLVVEGIEASLRREQKGSGSDPSRRLRIGGGPAPRHDDGSRSLPQRPLGEGFRRSYHRTSGASTRRDRSS